MTSPTQTPPPAPQSALRMFLLGGLLPVIVFAVVESVYGTEGGLVAGILFGIGEMVYEYRTQKRIQGITIASNALVVILGGLSLFEGTGVWFKMQPAILLAAFAVFLFITSLLGKPFLVALAKKQNPNLPEAALEILRGLNFRISFVFLGLAALSVYAALYWTTAAWATLKGVGVPVILVAYMVIEVVIIRILRARRT